jgi:hypothetical protein
LVRIRSKHPLSEAVCPPLPDRERTLNNFQEFEKHWDPVKGNLGQAMWKAFGTPFALGKVKQSFTFPLLIPSLTHFFFNIRFVVYVGGLLKLGYDTIQIGKPQLLRLIITFISTSDGMDLRWGFILCGILLGISILQSVMIRNYFFINYKTGMALRSAAIAKLFRKNLSLSQTSRSKFSSGSIINLMSVDTTRLQDLTTYLHTVWSGVFQIVGYVCVLDALNDTHIDVSMNI